MTPGSPPGGAVSHHPGGLHGPLSSGPEQHRVSWVPGGGAYPEGGRGPGWNPAHCPNSESPLQKLPLGLILGNEGLRPSFLLCVYLLLERVRSQVSLQRAGREGTRLTGH